MNEQVMCLGKGGSLVGIMTDPPEGKTSRHLPGILLLNAGMLHRVGPGRLYVKLARDLAASGFSVLRFDFSGIGDSQAGSDQRHFETRWMTELQEVMDAFGASRGMGRFVLIGLCSGASFSFRGCRDDARVVGAVLVNPQDHLHDRADDEKSAAIRQHMNARHGWRIALSSSFSGKKWLKALRGEVDYRSVTRLVTFQLRAIFQPSKRVSPRTDAVQADLTALRERGVELLHVFSEGDVGFDYLKLMVGGRLRDWIEGGFLGVRIIRGANHTFTLLSSQEELLRVVGEWARVFALESDATSPGTQ